MTDKKNNAFMALLNGIARWFIGIGLAIKDGAIRFAIGVKNFFINFVARYKDGSKGTKLSHFAFGAGNFYHKQYIKGAIYLGFQLLFLAIMIFNPNVNSTPIGLVAFRNFFTLGTEEGDIFGGLADNSMLMLLFGVVTMGLCVLMFLLYLSNIKSSYKADLDIREGKTPTTFKQDLFSLLDDRFHITLLTPTFIGVTFFTILPTIFMILIAFTNFDRNHQGQVLFDWVGFVNFGNVFGGNNEIGAKFPQVFSWTIVWAVIATFTCYFGGIFLALLINKKGIKFRPVFRTVFVLTIAIPQFVSLLAVSRLLSLSGPLQTLLINIGILDKPTELLAQADNIWTARTVVLFVNFWLGVPYTMLMTSGILLNIPSDLYEAAKIDGAKPPRILFKITMPYIIFITTPYLISAFIGNINSFGVIFFLTGGAPADRMGRIAGGTDILVTWLFKLTIEQNDYNLGSVIGIFTFMITSTITLLTYRNTKAYKEEGAFQ